MTTDQSYIVQLKAVDVNETKKFTDFEEAIEFAESMLDGAALIFFQAAIESFCMTSENAPYGTAMDEITFGTGIISFGFYGTMLVPTGGE